MSEREHSRKRAMVILRVILRVRERIRMKVRERESSVPYGWTHREWGMGPGVAYPMTWIGREGENTEAR